MKNTIVALTLCIASVVSVRAATPVGASFLTINQSPRTASLGGAGSANIADVSSLYINPAGLASISQNQLTATHTQLFGDSSLSSMAYGYPFGAEPEGQTLGIGVTYLSYGTIEGRNADRSDAGSFRPSDLSGTLSYARIVGRMTAGLSIKAIRQNIGSDSATGMAADIGVQRKLSMIRGLHVGMAVTNLGPSMKFISEKYALPTTARFGLGYSIGMLNIISDVGAPTNGGKSWFSLGTEFTPVSILSLRAGYLMAGQSRISDKASSTSQLARFAGLSGGVGLRMGRYQLDYAMTPHEQLGLTQQIGFSVNFR